MRERDTSPSKAKLLSCSKQPSTIAFPEPIHQAWMMLSFLATPASGQVFVAVGEAELISR